MQRTRSPLVLILALAAAVVGGCGRRESVRTPDSTLSGPPTWRLAREGLTGTETGFTLQARTPGRARFRLEATDNLTRTSPWRDLASGQTILLSWSQGEEPPELVADAPADADRTAGRTEGHAALLTFGFSDRAAGRERYVFFTRPGQGRLLTRDLLPPGKYEPLAVAAPIEVATLVFTDLASGAATLRSQELASRIVLPDDMAPGDRVMKVQLFLEIELHADEAADPDR